MQFNVDGSYLATIGGAPDHMLTIWDWKIGSVILRAKAFSQEVFKVRFSPYNQVLDALSIWYLTPFPLLMTCF